MLTTKIHSCPSPHDVITQTFVLESCNKLLKTYYLFVEPFSESTWHELLRLRASANFPYSAQKKMQIVLLNYWGSGVQ